MSYKHLTIEERSCIYQFLNLGMSVREIAKALRRSLDLTNYLQTK